MVQRENDPINAPRELGTVPEDHRYYLKGIEDLSPGDHLCFIYRTEKEHREFMTRYLKDGLLNNEKVFYIFHDHKPSTIMHYLEKVDVNIKDHIEKGQFRALSVDEAYMKGGVFEPDTMIEILKAESQKALDEGYTTLRVTGEMTWALGNLPGSERLIEYEAKLNTIFQSSKLIALCQYNRYKFDPEFLMEVVATHPFVVYNSEIYCNYDFVDATKVLYHDRAPILLDNSLRNLATRKRLEIELWDKARKLLETLDFPIWVWKKLGDDFILDYYNQSGFALRTANFKGLNGKMFKEMFSEYPELIEDIETAYKEKRELSREMVFRRGKEGERIYLQCIFIFMEPNMILMKGLDISKEMVVKEKLNACEGRYQELMGVLQEGVWTIDADSNTTYVNEYMAYLLGYKPEEMIGKNLFDFMDEHWKTIGANNIKRRKEGIRESHEFEFLRKDGSRVYTTLTVAPLRDKNKSYAGAIATVRDITKEKKDQLKKRKDQMRFHLEERNIYIVKEATSSLSKEIFKNLLHVGLMGYVISRTPKREFSPDITGKYKFIQHRFSQAV
jgi:PAS domain S-box-containing protein